jgi:hypothetical protein
MKVTFFICALLSNSGAFGQYQLQVLTNPVAESERNAQRAFADWRQIDEPLLRDVLSKPPDQAQRLVSRTAQAAKQYTSAQIDYFKALRDDVLRDIADLQSRGGGAPAGSIQARRSQMDRESIVLYDEDKRLESEIKRLNAVPESRTPALIGILEAERDMVKQQRDNVTLQMKYLEGMTSADANIQKSNRALIEQFRELDHLYENQVTYSQKLSQALDDYYASLERYVGARAKKLEAHSFAGSTAPATVVNSGIGGIWEYVRSVKASDEDPNPARIRVHIQEQADGILSMDLAYWLKNGAQDSHPDRSWHFVGKLIAMSQSFDFKAPNGEKGEVTLDTSKTGSVLISWVVYSSAGSKNEPKHGPFTLKRVPAGA